jgi:hypothetical protein
MAAVSPYFKESAFQRQLDPLIVVLKLLRLAIPSVDRVASDFLYPEIVDSVRSLYYYAVTRGKPP